MTKITIPSDISISLNMLIDCAKIHWSKFYKMQQSLVNVIYYHLKAQKVKPVTEYPVKIEISWYLANRRRDPDNVSASKKFILDALVHAGILRDDTLNSIIEFRDLFFIDKQNPRVEIILTN